MQRRCTGNECILCGKIDDSDHFYKCKKVNESAKYKEIRDEIRHKAHAHGTPDYVINTIARLMDGKKIKPEDVPQHAEVVYKTQGRVGWGHFRKGRILKDWSKTKTTDMRGDMKPDERWRTGVVRIILQWTLRKWLLRCDMTKHPEEEHNHGMILEDCKTWWKQRREKRLMRTDIHLTREGNEAREVHTTEYLKGWLRTREIAKKAFTRYAPGRAQPTLHRWLVRREG